MQFMEPSSKALTQPCRDLDDPTVVIKQKKRTRTWAREWSHDDVFYAVVVASLHVLCLFAPFTFTWGALLVMVTLYVVFGLFGINLSYHRNLTHKSFEMPKYLEYFFAYLGLHALQGDPVWWVSNHRNHHKFTDTYRDPHTPIEGFWFSYILWVFDSNYIHEKGGNYDNVRDLTMQRYYRFLRQTLVFHLYLQVVILYMFGGLPFIVWAVGVRSVLQSHASGIVNSVCHTWGVQAWNTGDLSKNNWFVSIFVFGEGWHNNHHAFEYSARHGLEWWQIDTTWYVIKLLEYFGLATNVKIPSKTHQHKMSFKYGVEDINVEHSSDNSQ